MTEPDTPGHLGEVDQALVGKFAISISSGISDAAGGLREKIEAALYGVYAQVGRLSGHFFEIIEGFEILKSIDSRGEALDEALYDRCHLGLIAQLREDGPGVRIHARFIGLCDVALKAGSAHRADRLLLICTTHGDLQLQRNLRPSDAWNGGR